MNYDPRKFDAPDLDYARRIILTPQQGVTSEARWELETAHTMDLLGPQMEMAPDGLLLDYGCGIGRMAKAFIERYGCRVLGVDISASMRALALNYVASPKFTVCSPDFLDGLVSGGLRVDAALSIWVLQHCERPAEDVARLLNAIRSGGRFGVVNNFGRALPSSEGWYTDGIDVPGLLNASFSVLATGHLSAALVGRQIADGTFWAAYARP